MTAPWTVCLVGLGPIGLPVATTLVSYSSDLPEGDGPAGLVHQPLSLEA